MHATVVLPATLAPEFDDAVADLGELGGALCVGAAASPGAILSQKCGVKLGDQNVSLELQAAPAFSSLSEGATVGPTDELSWSSFDSGIHVLELMAFPPSPTNPNIYRFQSDTTATWPDLGPIGVSFPAGAAYQCSVGGLGPYTSMEDAFGPMGLGASFPSETRKSFSPVIDVTAGQ